MECNLINIGYLFKFFWLFFFYMECNKLCFICDVVNGECLFCIKFLYGEKCDKCCLYNCLDG